jgi:hypothetical protein
MEWITNMNCSAQKISSDIELIATLCMLSPTTTSHEQGTPLFHEQGPPPPPLPRLFQLPSLRLPFREMDTVSEWDISSRFRCSYNRTKLLNDVSMLFVDHLNDLLSPNRFFLVSTILQYLIHLVMIIVIFFPGE